MFDHFLGCLSSTERGPGPSPKSLESPRPVCCSPPSRNSSNTVVTIGVTVNAPAIPGIQYALASSNWGKWGESQCVSPVQSHFPQSAIFVFV